MATKPNQTKRTNQQSKQKNKMKQTQSVTSGYQAKYLGIGLVIAFLSILGLFKWGVFGILIANTFRLFVGEAYSILLMVNVVYASYMVIRGELVKTNIRILIGGLLIMCAITTFLHVNAFYPQEPLETNIIVTTFNAFRQDLLNSQMQQSLGGGLLGSVFYLAFGYLFGRWGTYLLVFILLSVGVILLARVQPATLQHWAGKFWYSIRQFFRKLFPAPMEVDVEYEETDYSPPPTTHKKWWHKLKEVFEQETVEDVKKDSIYQTAYQPAKSLDTRPEWQPYRAQDAPRGTRTSIDKERVLDLDYFDSMYESRTEQRKEVPIVTSQLPTNHSDESEQVMLQVDEKPQLTHTNQINTAGHWQNQAHIKQDLTTNELEEALLEEEQDISFKVKPKLSKQSYVLPGKDLLKKIPPVDQSEEYARINENIAKLEQTFESFGVKATVVKANLGPSVTKYEIQPAIGVKVSKIVSLSDDIALALAARDVRMEAPIPGKSLIGIEVPNHQVSPVSFWEIIDAALESPHVLEVPLGRDISGAVCLADLSKMPHLLIAGATGSGKSVGMNVIIVSLLMKAKPEDVKFLMIDPKKVELTMYDDIPHLLAPVVTNPRKAAQALNKVVQEMERRYELFATTGVRNIDGYNEQVDTYNQENNTGYERLPKIVVFVDELADLMMVASNEVENAIIRLAQMARAAGIHMIIATQRPSVDVITGIIKANVPSRLAFAVSSGIDSRTILDSNGAEKLLGRGDMLFQPMGKNKPVRVQGAYISDSEVERITNFVREQRSAEYDEMMIVSDNEGEQLGNSEDEYFEEAVEMIKELDTISISQLQRRFRIGYNRAARLIDDMEAQGIVSGQDGSKPRQVLINHIP